MSFDELVALTRIVGLVVFLVLFAGVIVWVFRPGSRRIYDAGARLPFTDDTERGPSRHG